VSEGTQARDLDSAAVRVEPFSIEVDEAFFGGLA
jgi:hypothetical protein